jgi:hypothetical protein
MLNFDPLLRPHPIPGNFDFVGPPYPLEPGLVTIYLEDDMQILTFSGTVVHYKKVLRNISQDFYIYM